MLKIISIIIKLDKLFRFNLSEALIFDFLSQNRDVFNQITVIFILSIEN